MPYRGALLGSTIKDVSFHVFFLSVFLFLVAHFGVESGMIFGGTTGVDERIYGFNSK